MQRTALSQVGKLLLGLWMTGVLVAMFLIIPQYEGLGNAGRIIIMHVPTAWVAVVAFGASAIFSGLYLWKGRSTDDDKALAAAESGFLFTILATITGAIFSQVVWGIYWNWDPRQTSIFVLMLIYGGLFALRAAIDDPTKRRQLSAVYALFAFVTVPFLIFVAPRMADSTLHPNCAFLPGSDCDGIVLSEGRIGLLGDRKVELLELQQQGSIATAVVEVSEPGLSGITRMLPTFDMNAGSALVSPEFAGLQYRLTIDSVDPDAGTARLNIQAPGTGILENQTTLYTFLASILGFTGLFWWMFDVRTRLLGLQWRVQQREGVGA